VPRAEPRRMHRKSVVRRLLQGQPRGPRRSMSESLPPLCGLLAGKYEVMSLIGRGGMGSVWLGRHTSLGAHVAIKFVDPEHAKSQEARSRFVTEARAAATIRSKHAIHIYDHGVTEDGRPYIVMELLAGEALDKRLERVGRLTLPETARLLGQVCRGLQRAHDAGIIHRDLKPENIFIVHPTDDDEEIAKVLDFGIAKIKPSPGDLSVTSSTKTGAVMGTPYYMSPEQARGLRNIDHRTDLWSLGVIAYRCLTGELPFDGESVGDLLVKICTSPLPTPSNTKGVPSSFDPWFFRVLERDVEKRFSSASDLADSLALLAGVTLRRGPPSGSIDVRQAPLRLGSASEAGHVASLSSDRMPSSSRTGPSRATWAGAVLLAVVVVTATWTAGRVTSAPTRALANAVGSTGIAATTESPPVELALSAALIPATLAPISSAPDRAAAKASATPRPPIKPPSSKAVSALSTKPPPLATASKISLLGASPAAADPGY
jgi:serine/threonine protein kinase